jgi:hypothetical protein
MHSIKVRQFTGIAGVIIFLLSMIVLPLYFVYNGPPPVSNILTRTLVNMFVCTALLIFLVGFRQLIREAGPGFEWIATLSFTFGLVFSTFLLTAAMAILGTHVLPKWTARMAQIIAGFHFALIPSIFSGTDPSYFYSIIGKKGDLDEKLIYPCLKLKRQA